MKTDYIIKRSIWRRGGCLRLDMGITQLLNRQGNMCCLGMICEQAGVPRTSLFRTVAPWALIQKDVAIPSDLAWLFIGDSIDGDSVSFNMMVANDDESIDDSEREATLTALAAKAGITLTFVD